MKFIKQFDREQGCVSVEYGMKYWLTGEDYGDINSAMVETMESHKAEIYPRLREKAKEKKLGEIETLKRELAKYE
jgi:hypothetical protein